MSNDPADIYEAYEDQIESPPTRDELWEEVKLLRAEVDSLKQGNSSGFFSKSYPHVIKMDNGAWFQPGDGRIVKMKTDGQPGPTIDLENGGIGKRINLTADFVDINSVFLRLFVSQIELFTGLLFQSGAGTSFYASHSNGETNNKAGGTFYAHRTSKGERYSFIDHDVSDPDNHAMVFSVGPSRFEMFADGSLKINGETVHPKS